MLVRFHENYLVVGDKKKVQIPSVKQVLEFEKTTHKLNEKLGSNINKCLWQDLEYLGQIEFKFLGSERNQKVLTPPIQQDCDFQDQSTNRMKTWVWR